MADAPRMAHLTQLQQPLAVDEDKEEPSAPVNFAQLPPLLRPTPLQSLVAHAGAATINANKMRQAKNVVCDDRGKRCVVFIGIDPVKLKKRRQIRRLFTRRRFRQ